MNHILWVTQQRGQRQQWEGGATLTTMLDEGTGTLMLGEGTSYPWCGAGTSAMAAEAGTSMLGEG
jgi:hypothetical protein